MRSIIKLLLVLVICLAGIGLYRGWFSFSSPPGHDPAADKTNVNMTIDKGKMKSDVKKAEDKVKEEFKDLKDKVKVKEEKK